MPRPGDTINFTKEQRESLGHAIGELVWQLEAENHDLISDKPIHREWYNGTPDVPIRSSPWSGASNIVVPFIRTMSDSLIARAVLTIFSSNKLWSGASENRWFRDRLTNWLTFLNYGARHGYDTFAPVHDFTTELYIHGQGIMQQVWEDTQREVVAPNAKSPTTVSLGRGPRLRFWPSEYILFNRECPISEAEIICLQNNMTWGKITREARLNGWDEEGVASIEGQQGLEGSAAQVRNLKRKNLGMAGQAADIHLEPHDIREVWLDWPLFKSMSTKFSDISEVSVGDHDPQAISVPIIVTWHRKTSTVLHAIYNPYLLPEWPFYEARYRNDDSRGLAKILEHIQRGMTTVVNQSIDAVTMANSVKFITNDPRMKSVPFVPNQPLYTNDLGSIVELKGQKNIFPEMSAVQMLQAMGERVGGQSDPNFGRETRMGGHPQPATNFLGQQANSQVLNTLPMKGLRRMIGKIGEHRTILYQQFERNRGDWISHTFDQDDAQEILDVIEDDKVVSGQIRFDVHALSETHNPDAERQKAILIDQMYTNYVMQCAKFMEVAANPQSPEPMKRLMVEAIETKGKSLSKFLEASDVDEVEEFVFQLQEKQNADIRGIEQLGERLRGAAGQQGGGAEGAVRGGGLEAIPGGAGEAEAEPARARGSDALFPR